MNLQMNNMNADELQSAIHTKAYSKIMNIELAIKSLQKERPHGAYTQEMIDNQLRFQKRDLLVWNQILKQND